MSLARFPWYAAPHREGAMLLVITVGIKNISPSSFVPRKEVHCFFSTREAKIQLHVDGCRCCTRETTTLLLFTVDIDFWILWLCHLSRRVHRPTTQLGVRMKRDEEALVILTIFTDQYPFMLQFWVHLGEVAPAVTLSFLFSPSFLPSCHFLLLPFTHSIQRVSTSWAVHAVPLRAALKDWRTQR